MLLLLAALASAPADAAVTWSSLSAFSAWELFKEKDTKNAGQVKLYEATIDGTPCFKAQATVSGVDAEKMLSVATDIEGAMSWSSAGLKDAQTLKKTSTAVHYYQYLAVPLISDRFWFLEGTIHRSGSRLGLSWEKTWDQGGPYSTTYDAVVAAHPNAIEPPVNVGAWLFDTAGSQVTATYMVCTDSGGAIPANLQSMATKSTLPTTVDDLVKEARTR